MNGGWDSPETRKNVFCEWQCDMGQYLTEEQLMKCVKKVDKFNFFADAEPLVAFVDLGYSGDRSIATIMNYKHQIIDVIVLKEERETKALRDQLEDFLEICDKKDYTHAFQTIGIDKTGLGIGAYEMLQEMTPCNVTPIVFTLQSKDTMYKIFKNHIITNWEEDRITIPEGHRQLGKILEEFTDIEQTVAENGLLKFHAPTNAGVKKYDDYCDSIVACTFVLFEHIKQFSKVRGYSKRHDRDKIFKEKLRQNKDRFAGKRRGPRKNAISRTTKSSW